MVLPGSKKLINILIILIFMVYISEKRGNSGASYITLERAWLAVYCVQVSKYELPCGPRKSPQNIETIEFC